MELFTDLEQTLRSDNNYLTRKIGDVLDLINDD